MSQTLQTIVVYGKTDMVRGVLCKGIVVDYSTNTFQVLELPDFVLDTASTIYVSDTNLYALNIQQQVSTGTLYRGMYWIHGAKLTKFS